MYGLQSRCRKYAYFLSQFGFIAVICVFALSAQAKSNPDGQDVANITVKGKVITINARSGPPIIPVTIGGETYTFLITPSFGHKAFINASIAKKHKIKNVNIYQKAVNFEGTKIRTKAGKKDIEIGGFFQNTNQLFYWFEYDVWPPYDGIIGAGIFKDYDKVVFSLSDMTIPQKQHSATLQSKGNWLIKTVLGEGQALEAWSNFSLQNDLTYTNLVLSKTLKDKGMTVPEKTVFNINRLFSIKAKLINGQLAKSIPLLRGNVTELKMHVPESSLIVDKSDDVVTVATIKRLKANEPPQINLGRDYFTGCTSLEFTPYKKRVDLFCNDDGN